MEYITEQQIDQIAGETGDKLRAEPKVKIIIPPGPNQKEYWEGGINGHFFRIKTDVEVEVPESLYRQIQRNRRVRKLSEKALEPYTKGAGKKVG